jgi:hypothetical protein
MGLRGGRMTRGYLVELCWPVLSSMVSPVVEHVDRIAPDAHFMPPTSCKIRFAEKIQDSHNPTNQTHISINPQGNSPTHTHWHTLIRTPHRHPHPHPPLLDKAISRFDYVIVHTESYTRVKCGCCTIPLRSGIIVQLVQHGRIGIVQSYTRRVAQSYIVQGLDPNRTSWLVGFFFGCC